MTGNRNRWYTGRPWEPGLDISPHQTEFATALRVPFLTSPYPTWNYVTGIVVSDDLWRGVVPTDEEVEVVAAARQSYQDYFFSEPNTFRAEMEAFAPYDVDGSAVGFYFIKKVDESWAYRRRTWSQGPTFVPDFRDAPMTLAEVIEHGGLHWERTLSSR